MSWQQIQPFLVALAIGLLLGLERERSHSRKLPAGSRSFALLSLVGAVAASFSEWAVLVGLIGVGALLALAYFRTSEEDPGTPSDRRARRLPARCARLHTPCGSRGRRRGRRRPAGVEDPHPSLRPRDRHRRRSRGRHQVLRRGARDPAAATGSAARTVWRAQPSEGVAPRGAAHRYRLGRLHRCSGPRARTGRARHRFGWRVRLGTATTASMGRLSRTATSLRAPLASALLASLATFVQLLIVIGLVDVDVLRRLWPPVVAGAVVLVGVAAFVYRDAIRNHQQNAEEGEESRRRRQAGLSPCGPPSS